MPLESPEKAADALFSETGRVVAPERESISTGFLEACDQIYQGILDTMMNIYNNINNLYSQLNTGGQVDYTAQSASDAQMWVIVIAAGTFIVYAIAKFVYWLFK